MMTQITYIPSAFSIRTSMTSCLSSTESGNYDWKEVLWMALEAQLQGQRGRLPCNTGISASEIDQDINHI